MEQSAENQQKNQSQDKFKPTDNPINDIYRDHRDIARKPNKFKSMLGKIVLASTAVTSAALGTRAVTENPLPPIKEAINFSNPITENFSTDKEEPTEIPNNPTTTPYIGSVGEGAISSEPANTNEFNQIFNKFVEDLKKIPAAKINNLESQGREGYKLAIEDNVYKFSWSLENPSEKEVVVETDKGNSKFTVKNDQLQYESQAENGEFESIVRGSNKTEQLTDFLNQAYEKWDKTKNSQPTPTPPNSFSTPGPFDRTNHKS